MENSLKEPPEALQAAKAWLKGDYDSTRKLYQVCINEATKPNITLSPSFYLAEWARHEASIGNRSKFEELFNQVFELEPNAPFWRLCFARDTWAELKDKDLCASRIVELEELLSSDRWNRSIDLAPLAYEQKIETLKAWLRGEAGGPIWP
jgi:hypothetical protein